MSPGYARQQACLHGHGRAMTVCRNLDAHFVSAVSKPLTKASIPSTRHNQLREQCYLVLPDGRHDGQLPIKVRFLCMHLHVLLHVKTAGPTMHPSIAILCSVAPELHSGDA